MKKKLFLLDACRVFAGCCLLLASCCLFLTGCQKKVENDSNKAEQLDETEGKKENASEQGEVDITERKISLSTWIVYWDMDGVAQELDTLDGNLTKLSYFEAYYSEDNKIILPDGFIEACKKINTTNAETYLSIVNDIAYEDGTSSLKDTDLLYELFRDDAAMERHIEELLMLAKENSADGVEIDGLEIDYERLGSDAKLWRLFETFSAKLMKRMAEEDLKLRIVLEPSAPYEELKLPKEAEFVIMCYNLHSGAGNKGPKADKDFLNEMIRKTQTLGENRTFALATGGFDWLEKKSVVALREEDAAALAVEYDAEVKRDDLSQALTFQYKESGKAHEVWYADGETIAAWTTWIKECGDYNIAVWRLNGNKTEAILKWMQ
ncbi:hypothetical protein LQZ18_14810 [Lachnospiraceae bacterium ZAX-1]